MHPAVPLPRMALLESSATASGDAFGLLPLLLPVMLFAKSVRVVFSGPLVPG